MTLKKAGSSGRRVRNTERDKRLQGLWTSISAKGEELVRMYGPKETGDVPPRPTFQVRHHDERAVWVRWALLQTSHPKARTALRRMLNHIEGP